MLEVDVNSVVSNGDAALAAVDAATAAGATAVILVEGDPSGGSTGGAAALYEAAVKLRELLRGRAALLLEDRTDIAMAAGAEGVVLTDAGASRLLWVVAQMALDWHLTG